MHDEHIAAQARDWLGARRVEVRPTYTGRDVVMLTVWPDQSRFNYTFPVARCADRGEVLAAFLRCLEAVV